MYRNIVVPLDGSTFAEEALPLAADIAKSTDGSLELVMVHQLISMAAPFELPVDVEVAAAIRQEEQSYLNEKAAAVRARFGVKAVAALRDGIPVAQSLAEYARSCQADLVVLSSHGRGGTSRFFLGSVADRLIRLLHCPAVVVHPSHGRASLEPGKPRRVLVPLDGSPLAESVVDQALALAPQSRLALELVHVVTPPIANVAVDHHVYRLYLEAVVERLRQQGLQVNGEVLTDENPAAAILQHAERRGCDLIALTTAGLGWMARALLGSVADKVVRGATIPVLVWNPPPDARSQVLDRGAAAAMRPLARPAGHSA
jgi:nucleotide-binding universal stress UspA family protein